MNRKAECACGKVSAVVEGDPVRVLSCHCDYCQKRTGSVFQVSCWYPHDRVIELNGETKTFSDSANSIGVGYNFCPNCGSTVYWTFDKMEEFLPGISRFLGFAVGCFADKNFPKPDVDVQNQYRHHWVPEFPGIAAYDAFAPPDLLMRDI